LHGIHQGPELRLVFSFDPKAKCFSGCANDKVCLLTP